MPGDSDGCILGKKYTMERRKRDSCCLNDNDYERTKTTETNCACGAYDVECQYGAERQVEFGECDRMPNIELRYPKFEARHSKVQLRHSVFESSSSKLNTRRSKSESQSSKC